MMVERRVRKVRITNRNHIVALQKPDHEHPEDTQKSEPHAKITEMKDDRILSSDKFPLENNRWGYLPLQVQKFLFLSYLNSQE